MPASTARGMAVRKAVDGLATGLNLLAAGCLLILILSASVDVAVRTVTSQGVAGVIEYGEVFLVSLAFLSMARTQQRDGHVAVDLVVSRFRPRLAAGVELAAMSVVLLVLLWVTWASLGQAIASVQTGEHRIGVVEAPVWPARIALVVGMAALSAVVALHLVRLGLIVRGRNEQAASLEPPTVPTTERAAS